MTAIVYRIVGLAVGTPNAAPGSALRHDATRRRFQAQADADSDIGDARDACLMVVCQPTGEPGCGVEHVFERVELGRAALIVDQPRSRPSCARTYWSSVGLTERSVSVDPPALTVPPPAARSEVHALRS
jgi:hypothetical protein